MAYIGREPTIGNFQVCDAISVVNGQAAYTMQVSSVNVVPETANHMIVSLNGIIQAPGSSYTVSGSTITFASNLVTGDVIDFIHILGSVLDLGVPSDSTVSLAKLTATGTKDATTFLRGDNTFAEAGGGKVLQVVQTSKTDTTSLTDTYSFTDISGMSVSITPSATSSKILILSTLNIASGAAAYGANVRLVRDSTGIFIGDAASSRVQATFSTISVDNNFTFPQTINYLDSPSTTSATTYKIQWNITYDNGTPTIYLNRSVTDSDAATNARTPSSIIAIEVGA